MSDKPNWMTEDQILILKTIRRLDNAPSASDLALSTNTDYSLALNKGEITRECEPLVEHGFAEEVSPMQYKVTRKGAEFLDNYSGG